MTGDETLRQAEEAELARRVQGGDDIVSPLADADERAIETALRPKRLTEFTGQARVREQLSLILTSALRRGRPPDHVLLAGPPGLGKTTIAMIVAAELGAPLRITSGPAIERSGDLAAVLSTLSEGEVIFIDEIHRLARPAEEMLYLAMEDFRVDVVIGKGPGATAIPLDIAPFTLVGATTRAGLLPAPLRDRFGFTAHLDFYQPDELEVIIRRSAGLLGVTLTDEGAAEPPPGHAARPGSPTGCCAGSATTPRCAPTAWSPGRSRGPRWRSTRWTSMAWTGSTGGCSTRWCAGSAAARSACPRWRWRWGRRRRPSRWSPSRSWSAAGCWRGLRAAGWPPRPAGLIWDSSLPRHSANCRPCLTERCLTELGRQSKIAPRSRSLAKTRSLVGARSKRG